MTDRNVSNLIYKRGSIDRSTFKTLFHSDTQCSPNFSVMPNQTSTYRAIVHDLQRQSALTDEIMQYSTADVVLEKPYRASAIKIEASRILALIKSLEHLLKSNRKQYLDTQRHLSRISYDSMSASDRQALDEQAVAFIKNCSAAIGLLEESCKLFPTAGNRKYHAGIVEWLLKRLTQVAQMHRNQQEMWETRQQQPVINQILPEDLNLPQVEVEDIQLSAQEHMALEQENQSLLDELLGTELQVRNAERTMLEISQMQNTITQHVLSQHEDILRMHDESVDTTHTVSKGNVVLAKATQTGVDFRNFMLMFFLLLSFVLLFLHWYDEY